MLISLRMRHYYIPEFLLKVWSGTTADQKVEAFRLDLHDIPSKRHSPKHTAYEEDLCALTRDQVAGLKKQDVETEILKQVDNLAANVLRKLLIGGLASLDHRDRCAWVVFIMSLRSRTPEFINYLKNEEPR